MKPPNVHVNMHTRSSAGMTGNGKTAYLRDEVLQRDVAQLGSAPEWGSGGRRFESGRPDCEKGLPRLRLRPRAGFSLSRASGVPAVHSRCSDLKRRAFEPPELP